MKRSGPLRRTDSLKRTAMKRRPKKLGWVKGVYRASRAELDRIRDAKGRRCRVCGTVTDQLHHLLGGILRSDEADNLIPLGGSGTTGCHGIYTSRMPGLGCDGKRRTWEQVAVAIRWSLTPRELRYVTDKVGQEGLDSRYPETA